MTDYKKAYSPNEELPKLKKVSKTVEAPKMNLPKLKKVK